MASGRDFEEWLQEGSSRYWQGEFTDTSSSFRTEASSGVRTLYLTSALRSRLKKRLRTQARSLLALSARKAATTTAAVGAAATAACSSSSARIVVRRQVIFTHGSHCDVRTKDFLRLKRVSLRPQVSCLLQDLVGGLSRILAPKVAVIRTLPPLLCDLSLEALISHIGASGSARICKKFAKSLCSRALYLTDSSNPALRAYDLTMIDFGPAVKSYKPKDM